MAVLKPYLEYRDSGVPWLGEVPKNWKVQKLRIIMKGVTERNRPDLPLLSVVREKGVILRDITEKGENRNFIPDDLSNYKVVREGQFVMNKMKAWQGSYGVSRYNGIVSPAYFVFDIHLVEGSYFHSAIRSKAYVPLFTQASDGVRIGQWDLSQVRMKEIPFFIPSLAEQSAIVRFLDHMDRRIRRYILAKQRLIKLLEEYKQVIIHRAVTRGLDPTVPLKPSGVEWLGDVPEHWEVQKFRHLVLPVAGIQMGPFGSSLTQLQVFDTGFKLFGQENTISGDFQRGSRWLTEPQFIKLQRYEICKGDLVLTRKGSIGKCRMVPHDAPVGIADSDTIRVRISEEKLSRRFAVMLLHFSAYLQFQIHSLQRGAVLGGLNTATIAELRIAVPPASEQDRIVEEIESKTSELDRSIFNVKREIALLREYRTRLISDVVTGKLDVQGIELPADKDAEVPTELNEHLEDDITPDDCEIPEEIPAEAD